MKKIDRALCAALKSRHYHEAKDLLKKGADANAVFEDKHHSLEDYFAHGNVVKMLELLCDYGLDINRKDHYDHTLLETAIYLCDKKMFQFLLKTGKQNLRTKTSFGISYLCLALKARQKYACDKCFVVGLLEAGADWRQDKCFVIDEVEAVEYGDSFSKLASFLIKKAVFFK